MRNLLVITFAIATVARAQEFEAASVKPSAPPTQGMMRIGMRGGPGSADPERINYTNTSLKDVLTLAYDIKRSQVFGPDWLDSQRFDITATMAPGTTKAQFQVMLQKLLADRFKLTAHHEQKELPAFVLTVSKKGSKLKETVENPPAKEGDAKPVDGPPPAGGPTQMKMGKDGFPVMPAGRRGSPMMMIMPGKARMKSEGSTMQAFADSLERFLNRPVSDQTGLKGKYDFDLTFAPDMAQMFGGHGPMMAGGPPGGGGPMEPPKVEEGEVPTLFAAVQEQLGLKLDSQKTSVDALIIDHLEKAPTDN